MSNYKTTVEHLNVNRNMSDKNQHYEPGEPTTAEVTVGRRNRSSSTYNCYQRLFRFKFDDGTATLRTVEPVNPKSNSSTDQFQVRHVRAMEWHAMKAVSRVPEVDEVSGLTDQFGGPGSEPAKASALQSSETPPPSVGAGDGE